MSDEPLGVLLRRLRTARDLTLERLAEASGVSDRTISDIERGASLGPQRRTVELLVDALGLDSDDREALLEAARAGRHRQPAVASPAASLPRVMADFTGRQAELARLADVLRPGSPERPAPVAVLHGPPGFGKTTAAVRFATDAATRFDGVHLVDLRGFDARPLDALGVITRLVAAVAPEAGKVPRRLEGAVELWRSVVAGRRLLLVLDNASTEDQVRAVLPPAGPTAVLVTSRRPLAGLEAVSRVALDELSPAESDVLLRSIVTPAQAEGQDLARLARLCGHVPLALRIAGNRLAARDSWTVDDLAVRLDREDARLDGLRAGDLAVRSTVTLSYDRLSTPARTLFRRLAVLRGTSFADAHAVLLLSDDPGAAPVAALDELLDFGLVQVAAQGRYRVHDLLRLYARERLFLDESPEQREAVAAALRRWLLHTTVDAGRWFEPDFETAPDRIDPWADLSTKERGQAWLRAEADHWLAALEEAGRTGEHALVVEVAEAVHWFSDTWAYWGHWDEVYGLAVTSARALQDDDLLATHLGYLAWAQLWTRSNPAAALGTALEAHEVARRAANPRQEGWALFYAGWAGRQLDDLDASARYGAQAAALLEESGDVEGQLQARRLEAISLGRAGRHADAVASERRTLVVLDEVAGQVSEHVGAFTRAATLANLAHNLVPLGAWAEVMTTTDAALDAQEGLGVSTILVSALRSRAEALLALGRPGEAVEHLHRALAECDRTGDTSAADGLHEVLARAERRRSEDEPPVSGRTAGGR